MAPAPSFLEQLKQLPPVPPHMRIPRPYDYLADEYVYNFAIGSNLLLDRISARLGGGQPWASVEPAKAANHRLGFMGAFCPIEPAVATIEPEEGETIHGLLIKFPREKYEDLFLSEGGPLFAFRSYHEYVLQVETYSGEKRPTIALRGNPMWKSSRDAELPPSQRYMDLVKAGARSHSLDPDYIQRLDRYPVAPPPHPFMAWLGTGFMAAFFMHAVSGLPFRYQFECYRHLIVLLYTQRYRLSKRADRCDWTVRCQDFILLAVVVLVFLPTALFGHGSTFLKKMFEKSSGRTEEHFSPFAYRVKKDEEEAQRLASMAKEVDAR